MHSLTSLITLAFADVEYPGDANLRNSDEGQEPYLLQDSFEGKDDWRGLSPTFLDEAPDGFATALSFFSPEAFRFYLPAYLLAELEGELERTDVVFYLTYGLTDETKETQVNPRRYGDLSWFEYVSERFSIFTQNQAQAVVASLNHKRRESPFDDEREAIEGAIRNFWGRLAAGGWSG